MAGGYEPLMGHALAAGHAPMSGHEPMLGHPPTSGHPTTTGEEETGELKLVNRLAESRSPYVRGHMKNPVAWQMWNEDALALAKKSNRLLFVSVGYAACHCKGFFFSSVGLRFH